MPPLVNLQRCLLCCVRLNLPAYDCIYYSGRVIRASSPLSLEPLPSSPASSEVPIYGKGLGVLVSKKRKRKIHNLVKCQSSHLQFVPQFDTHPSACDHRESFFSLPGSQIAYHSDLHNSSLSHIILRSNERVADNSSQSSVFEIVLQSQKPRPATWVAA